MFTPSQPAARGRGFDGHTGPGEVHDSPTGTASGEHPPSPLPVAGLEELWAETRGDERVCVALLDGPVDQTHPNLRGARLQQLEALVPSRPDGGAASRHGLHVASIVFGRPDGLAPHCRGVVIPIFESTDADSFQPCSQLDLARALTAAILAGAHVINVSGGQFSPSGTAHPLLADVVRRCAEQGVLIVAAAGNEGCECLHVPAALDSVLAVGAMDAQGEPLEFSNWGGPYQTQGVLAPGERIAVARPGGGREFVSGTSYATALVSGVAALLLCLQLRCGQRPDPQRVRAALLAGARGRHPGAGRGGERYLAGRLDVRGAESFLTQGKRTMAEVNELTASYRATNDRPADAASRLPTPPAASTPPEPATPRVAEQPAEKKAGSCGCGCSAGPRLVYALGQLGYDFPNEARLDAFAQKLAAAGRVHPPERGLAFDPRRLLAHLEDNPWDAAAIVWTLSVEGTPLYALRPAGPFAADAYRLLRRFLQERLDEGVERISVPGVLAGQQTLLNGQAVPVIVPELRGMYSWTTAALAEAVAGPAPADGPERDGHAQHREGVRNFLARVYHEVRNLGLMPQDRALNYAATNAFEMGAIYAAAIRERMELDRVAVVPSPIGRPGSDCWDVEVYFFYPERQVQTVRKVYRFTVDVSDTVPVTVGATRSWFTR
jgi:hypothetical protein